MLKKIALSGIFFCLFIASWLAAFNIDKVSIGGPFLALLKQTNTDLNNFKIAIPDIPLIPKASSFNGFLVVLNALIDFFNIIVNIINIVVDVVNVVIQLIEFICLLIKNIVVFATTMKNQAIESSALATF